MKPPLPFQQINEFRLLSVIQDSPFSISLRGYQPALKRPVFIKLLKPQVKDHAEWAARFTREAQVSARLRHPNIVDVYTIGEIDGYTYMAMEFVPGLSLKELLEREKSLPLPLSSHIFSRLLRALEFSHENGIIHRDVKPGNILLDVNGNVKLTDFGLAHLGEESTMTQQGAILGSPAYMAPEQITGEPLFPAADFFAAGVTLYEMLSGVKPFSGENYSVCIQKILNETPPPPSEIVEGLPRQADGLILQLLEKDAAKRPSCAAEILAAISQFITPQEEAGATESLRELVRKHYTPDAENPDFRDESQPASKKEQDEPAISAAKRKTVYFTATFVIIAVFALFLWKPWGNFQENRNSAIPATVSRADSSAADGQMFTENSGADTIIRNARSEQTAENRPAPATSRHSPAKTNSSGDSLRHDLANNSKMAATGPSHENAALPDSAFLELKITPWASVTLDGQMVDSMASLSRLAVPAGEHLLVLNHPEFPPKVLDIKTAPGETRPINFSFLQNAGFLSVEVRPWAEVYIDGKLLDSTPLERPIILGGGEHVLELKHPEFQTFRQVLTITAGDTLRIKKNLTAR
ncbi:MAG: serine/threonine protein kinase [Calditrichia bacterium]